MKANDLDCKIYVEADLAPEDLGGLLAALVGGTVSSAAGSRTVQSPIGEIDIRNNPDSDKVLAQQFPDGFLFFRYTLEFYPSATARREDRISLVERILRQLWSRGYPAVAACDYEDDLPNRGGYNDRNSPWIRSEQFIGR
jgi:hypothetical protein